MYFCSSTMPKRKPKTDHSEEVNASGGRQRSKTMLTVIKTKLRRNRTGSVDSEPDKLPPQAKCATLPARMSFLEKDRDRNKPKTLFWMEELLDTYEGSLGGVTRKDSDESVDSGFDQVGKVEGSESDSNSSPGQSKALLPNAEVEELQTLGVYDQAAFEKAFGPMKDVGRWYSTYSSQQVGRDSEERYINTRPFRPSRQSCRWDGLEEEEDERLASRPLPPLPLQGPPAPEKTMAICVSGGAIKHDCVYETVDHRLNSPNGLTLGLRNLACHGWYWGPVTRIEAEEKLHGTKDGTFLVRDSSDDRYLLSLSFRSQGKTLHTRIEFSSGFFSFYSFPDSESEGYQSVVELIVHSMAHSRDGVFCFSRARALGSPAVPVRLLNPLSRFNHVRSLQHYCRFVIRQNIRFDMIRELPLPRHVHGYLEQSQF